jgi:hypothetical protein
MSVRLPGGRRIHRSKQLTSRRCRAQLRSGHTGRRSQTKGPPRNAYRRGVMRRSRPGGSWNSSACPMCKPSTLRHSAPGLLQTHASHIDHTETKRLRGSFAYCVSPHFRRACDEQVVCGGSGAIALRTHQVSFSGSNNPGRHGTEAGGGCRKAHCSPHALRTHQPERALSICIVWNRKEANEL